MTEYMFGTLAGKVICADCPECGYEGDLFVDTIICTMYGITKLQTPHHDTCSIYQAAMAQVVAGANSPAHRA